MTREFEIIRRPEGPGVRITCRCGATHEIGTSTSSRKHKPPEAVANIFRAHGWAVGRTPKKDRCPECRRTGRAANKTGGTDMKPSNLALEPRPPVDGAADMPPREMTREDRRIVFAKLEETYVDERTGYQEGWSDERVARDLNCPRKWVEVIRDENFGPQRAPESPEVVALRKTVNDLERDAKATAELAAEAKRQASNASRKAAEAADHVAAVSRRLAAVLADLNKLTGRA